jgi:hypothetical protein
MRERRRRYFADKRCEHCGSNERLELNHKIPRRYQPRRCDHRIWSLSPERFAEAIEGTEVLCHDCHLLEGKRTGVCYAGAKLSPDDVRQIRRLYGSVPTRELADRYGVRPASIRNAATGRTFDVLPDPAVLAELEKLLVPPGDDTDLAAAA